MNIELMDKNKLIVFLNEEDMQNFNITYDSISWQDQKTRVVFAKLLTLAQRKTGFSINKSDLSIEVIPQFKGCIILFSLKSKVENKALNNLSSPIVLHIENAENIMDLSEKSHDCWNEVKSNTLFLISDKYLLIVYPKSEFSNKFMTIISEYGNLLNSNNITIAWIKENAEIICENNALECIGKHIISAK